MKAVNVKVLDVRKQTDVADAMIVASGNSDRHVRAIAQHVVDSARATQRRAMGVEGSREGEWVLVDLQDVIVHVMLPRVREFYSIEQLWETAPGAADEREQDEASPVAAAAPGARRLVPRARVRRLRADG